MTLTPTRPLPPIGSRLPLRTRPHAGAESDPGPRWNATVVVVSGHAVVRAGLHCVLWQGLGPSVALSTSDRVDDLAEHLSEADVVLYDVIGLQEGRGEELTRLVGLPGVRVLALTRDLLPDLTERALDIGVTGCVSMDGEEDAVTDAVRTAVCGSGRRRRHVPAARTERAADLLSSRETDVIARIALGMPNLAIAADLFLSINSVKTYVRTAYRRIGVSSRSQAVAWAIQNGFPSYVAVEPPPLRR